MSRIEEKSKEIEKNKIEEINNENIEKDGLKKIPIEDTQKNEEKNIMPVKKKNKKHNVIIVTMITLIVFILILEKSSFSFSNSAILNDVLFFAFKSNFVMSTSILVDKSCPTGSVLFWLS